MVDSGQRNCEQVDVAIIGAGPAGLSAATELKRQGVAHVVVLERSASAGGVPQMCHHTGFGMRDRHRIQMGPAYAKAMVMDARLAGVDTRLNSTVTGWKGPKSLLVTSEKGLSTINADAVLIATGVREGSRGSALVPGDRPGGILTTGSLQRLVYGHGFEAGHRAVIVGAELVSYSALLTLRSAGVKVAAMVTREDEVQLYSVLSPVRAALSRLGRSTPLVPVMLASELVKIEGTGRVNGVLVIDNRTGREQRIDCDTVVFTGDWKPEREIAVDGGVRINLGSGGPGIDETLMTSVPGVFAAGNILRGVEQADYAALEGRRAASSMASYLSNRSDAMAEGVPISAGAGVEWVVPDRWRGAESSSTPILLRATEPGTRANIVIRSEGRVVYSRSIRRVPVNHTLRIPASWAGPMISPRDASFEVSIER